MAARLRDGSDGHLAAGWHQKYGRELRKHGYRGRWEKNPAGEFGNVWKTLKDVSALAAEVKRLDRMRV